MTTLRGMKLVTPPAFEPVTLQEIKDHLRIEHASDDAYLSALIVVAREQVESDTERALVAQTWELSLDYFPPVIYLPKAPLVSVTSVKYFDTDGVEQTLASNLYEVDTVTLQGRIQPAPDESWPDTQTRLSAVTVQFVAGYGDAVEELPARARQAMLLLIAHFFENREATIALNLQHIPLGYHALLQGLLVAEV